MDKSPEMITLDTQTVRTESICCAFSDKKHKIGVQRKQDWLTARFAEGLHYKRLNVRGKIFIEYIPAEYAWSPVDAPNYLLIHCFWVSGQYKGQGWGKQLLEACFADAAGKAGVVVVSSKKTQPFLTDKKFFVKHGFEVCDSAAPYFELLVKRCDPHAPRPAFRPSAKTLTCANQMGFTFMHTDLCPFSAFWADQMQDFARKYTIPAQIVRITSREEAQNFPTAFPIFSVFYNGQFVTHELLNENKFAKMVQVLPTQG
jgi:hypothetical protein